MAASGVPAALQHVQEPRNIGIDVVVRGGQRVAHARLGGEMHHIGEAVLLEQRRHPAAVVEIEFLEPERSVAGQLGDACLLEAGVVIGVEVVDPDHRTARRQQMPRDMEPDEPGRTRHQNRRIRHVAPLRFAGARSCSAKLRPDHG